MRTIFAFLCKISLEGETKTHICCLEDKLLVAGEQACVCVHTPVRLQERVFAHLLCGHDSVYSYVWCVCECVGVCTLRVCLCIASKTPRSMYGNGDILSSSLK